MPAGSAGVAATGAATPAAFVGAFLHWSGTDFGGLTTDDMRLPLLGMLLVVAGAQVVLVSFLLSLTRIGEDAVPGPAPVPAPRDLHEVSR